MRRMGWELGNLGTISPLAWPVAGPSRGIPTSSQQSCVRIHETISLHVQLLHVQKRKKQFFTNFGV